MYEEVLGWFFLTKDSNYTALFFLKDWQPIIEMSQLRVGDIFIFGPPDQTDYHKLHLGIFMGEFSHKDQPIIWHATNHPHFRNEKPKGGVLATPLQELLQLNAYQKLFGVRRFHT